MSTRLRPLALVLRLWGTDASGTALAHATRERREMSSVLRSVKKRKKGRTLGGVDVIDREEYAELEVDAKVALIRSLVPLGLMHIEELLDEEVTALSGERYARKDPSSPGNRHRRPGRSELAGPRGRSREPLRACPESEVPLSVGRGAAWRSRSATTGCCGAAKGSSGPHLWGRSRSIPARSECRRVDRHRRAFIEARRGQVREHPRAGPVPGSTSSRSSLDGKTVDLQYDGRALGITMTGENRFLGFVETDTENEKVSRGPWSSGASTSPRDSWASLFATAPWSVSLRYVAKREQPAWPVARLHPSSAIPASEDRNQRPAVGGRPRRLVYSRLG